MKLNIPIWLKSIVLGFIILELGTKLWSLIALGNIRLSPSIPWSFPLMGIILFFIWKYLDGAWLPKSTQETRQLWMRANSLTPKMRIWGWISAVLLGAALLSFIVLGTRIMDVPSGQIEQVERISIYPFWTIIALITMTSIVAGVMEEIAFRGYMQKPLEMKYGPKWGILIVALFFTLLHLPNATINPHIMPIFFIGSLGWGVLAYLTNSIIPGVVVHSAIDLIGYVWVWRNLETAKVMSTKNVLAHGIDTSFVVLIFILISLSILVVLSFRKLYQLNARKVGDNILT